jgi:hypothetical protein
LSDIQVILEATKSVISVYKQFEKEKINLPEKYKSSLKYLFKELENNANRLEDVVHIYEVSTATFPKLLNYRNVLEKHPHRINDVITDEHLRNYLKEKKVDITNFSNLYYQLGSTIKNTAKRLPLLADRVSYYLKELEVMFSSTKYNKKESLKTLILISPLAVGLLFLISLIKGVKEFGTGYISLIGEPLTTTTIIISAAIIVFFIAFFKKFSKHQREFELG